MPIDLPSMFEPLSRSASVKSVFGEAVSANGKTIIPVARVAYGFGGGRGRKRDSSEEGEGGGGGVYAVPVGVLEITDDETRFIAWTGMRKLAGAALAGFCLGAWWAMGKRR